MRSWIASAARTLVLCVAGFLFLNASVYAAFLEKKFVVCQDQGRDVLCDYYVVKKDDYVTKLFKQRGEIAYRDFPKFLEIFKRLNPAVKDVDLIYPNQRILVPLRLIEPNTLEGQSSGTVTIPLITITNIPRALQQNSMNYVVQQGDTVSALIAKKFGRYSTRPYKEAVKIFKYLNPQIKDLNLIHVGQTINIPVPAVRDESWYPEIFDDEGELIVRKEEVADVPEAEVVEVIEEAPAVPEMEELAEASEEPESIVAPPAEPVPPEAVPPPPPEEKIEEAVEKEPPAPPEEPAPVTPLPSIFKKAAAIFNATLLDTGEYFFPRSGKEDLALDLAATPVMEFQSGARILFGKSGSLSASDQAVVASFWKNLQIVTMSYDATLRELLYTICQLVDTNGCDNKFTINDRGVSVTVRGELIYDRMGGSGKVCVTLLDHLGQKMSDDISGYLSLNELFVSEWIDKEDFFGPVPAGSAGAPLPGYFIVPDLSDPKAFVKDFAAATGMRFQENVEISFPYAGFQVNAVSNLLSVAAGTDFLMDFGDLQGDAVEAIEKTGFRVLQMGTVRDYAAIIGKLLSVMPAQEVENPVFWGADRDRNYNAAIQIPGRLVNMLSDRGKIKILITAVTPHDAVLSFLNHAGIRVFKISDR